MHIGWLNIIEEGGGQHNLVNELQTVLIILSERMTEEKHVVYAPKVKHHKKWRF